MFYQVSRLERKLAETEEHLHAEMTAKDELESDYRSITVKLAKVTDELGEEVRMHFPKINNIYYIHFPACKEFNPMRKDIFGLSLSAQG